MHINFATSAAGFIQVELQDTEGRAIPGYGLANCDCTSYPITDCSLNFGGMVS